ncbi:outer membrane beta-barrel protein [Cesiribacter andamanensis]|uniref:Outer membrane receptor for Fe3+-dicitrate n=1 Tax=Cesiribacter andamanensis AMV16 TaxID=1279009 RepID=M7MX61_9BACT|nr:outer membrane beta-barrel protein [Cesiribacter andamanensis]EMR01018.1 Outer membrane receptor for Fe3+-dicitrate [Cesiribacter andamanensis AMV16]
MKTCIQFFVLSLLFCSQLFAQEAGRLRGKLLDTSGAAVAYANVAVLHASDNRLATGAVSNDSGEFSISSPAAGTYLLRITAIGFADYTSAPFEVSGPGFSKNFGSLGLKEDVETLQEVTVQALRPTITQEADRMVVSVEGTALAAGSTAYEVLAKSPGVYIDQDGNVQLNGKAGVTIMLDGRLTYLSAKELRNMLEGMSAENIKNIEIITNPSSKYDAEGSSGILNINLKKNDQRGMNGSLYAGYSYNRLNSYSAGGTINYKAGKWNTFLTLDAAQRVRGREGIFFREFAGPQETVYFHQDAREEVIRKAPSLRFGSDYSLNDRHSLGFMANIALQDASFDFRTDTEIGPAPQQPLLRIDARNLTASRYSNYTTNLHYQGRLDTVGTTLTADLDYVRITDKTSASFFNLYDTLASSRPVTRDFLLSENPSGYDIYAAKADFTRPLPQGRRLELGAKVSRVISDNDLRFYFHNTETPLPDPNRTNHFIYKENIFAAYANFSSKLGSRITLQAGLRAEQTLSEGKSLTTGQVTDRSYLNLFPSLFVQQKVSEQYQLNWNYSRRIQRPNYEQLNPFIFYLDPFTWAQGNPYLRPQYTHAISLTQSIKQQYTLVLEYQLTKDFIAEVPSQYVETSTTVFNRSNVDDSQNLSMTAIAPVKFHKKWDSNNTLVVARQEFSSVLDGQLVRNKQLFYMLQSNHTVMLPLGLRLEVNAGYQGPVVWGLYRIEKQHWVNLGLKKSFWEDKLDLSLTANDILKGQRVVGGANIGENVNQFNQYFFNRSIGINLRYRFSKGEQFDARRRNTTLEELNRAGG